MLGFIPLYPKKPLFDIVNTWVYIRAEDFVVFSLAMGLTPVLAVRFNREGWLFLDPKQLEDSGVNWVVNLKKAKANGKRFDQFFEEKSYEEII